MSEERDWEYINKDKSFSHWALRSNRFYAANVTHATLPPAVYETKKDDQGQVFARKITFPSDELIHIPGTPTQYVLNRIKSFWGKEEQFKDLGLVFKQGVLFYGPAGCGKTSIIHMLVDDIVQLGGLAIHVEDSLEPPQEFLLQLRQVEPNRKVLAIFEDIEKLMDDKTEASNLLSFLDGEKQIGNIVSVATTNKPDTLEDTLTRRPGRFDLVIGLNPPVADARRMYLKKLFKSVITDLELNDLVDETEGFGMAHLKEIAISAVCFDMSPREAVRRMRDNIKAEIKMPKLGQKVTGYTVGFSSPEEKQ